MQRRRRCPLLPAASLLPRACRIHTTRLHHVALHVCACVVLSANVARPELYVLAVWRPFPIDGGTPRDISPCRTTAASGRRRKESQHRHLPWCTNRSATTHNIRPHYPQKNAPFWLCFLHIRLSPSLYRHLCAADDASSISAWCLVVVGWLGVCGQVFAHMTEQGIHDAVAMVDRNSDGHLSKSGNSYCLSETTLRNPTTQHNTAAPHNR